MKSLSDHLNQGNTAIIPTDTLYGIVACASNKSAVERIYTIKGRDENKPFIILIPHIDSLADFGVFLSEEDRHMLSSLWPGAVSVILPLQPEYISRFHYLHRGEGKLAFRLPDKQKLMTLLRETGPLVAPSANPQGQPPATNIEVAKTYFGDKIEYYEDGGELGSEPSTLCELIDGKLTVLREGKVRIAFKI